MVQTSCDHCKALGGVAYVTARGSDHLYCFLNGWEEVQLWGLHLILFFV